jgi:hypothetical protein
MKISKKFSKVLESVDVVNEDESPKYALNRKAFRTLTTVEGKIYKLAVVRYEGRRGGVIYAYLSSDQQSYCDISRDDNDFGIVYETRFTGQFIKWV